MFLEYAFLCITVTFTGTKRRKHFQKTQHKATPQCSIGLLLIVKNFVNTRVKNSVQCPIAWF